MRFFENLHYSYSMEPMYGTPAEYILLLVTADGYFGLRGESSTSGKTLTEVLR